MEKQNQISELQLELTAHCNSNCTMCLRDKLERPKGQMDTETAMSIIDSAVEMGAKLLKPQWFGESLLCYNWKQITIYAKTKGMKIMLITNGSLMDEENRIHTVKYVDKVFFSVDSHIKEVYEGIRRGLKYDVVINNIKKLYELRNKEKSSTKIYISVVKTEENKHEIDGLKDFFKKFTDGICINDEIYCKKPDKNMKKVKCSHGVERRIVVSWEGKVYLCCHDWLGHYYIGDLKTESMEEIWNGEKRKKYLETLHFLSICQQCMAS